MRMFYLSYGLALLLSQPAFAQLSPARPDNAAPRQQAGPAPLTLAQAIALAYQHNPELAATTREIGVAEGGLVQAQTRPNPELSLLSEGLRQDNRTTTVQLSQAIELGGKRAARIAVAERERDLALADVAARRSDVRANVIAAYFEALTAQERLDLARASQQVAQAATGVASRRVLAGKISPVEETRAKVAEAGIRLELGQAASALALAQRRLGAIWGGGALADTRLDTPPNTDVPLPQLSELATHLNASPQLQRARLQVERQQAQAALERSRRIPDLTLSLGRKRDTAQESRSQTVIGVAIPLPLFDRNQGNLLSALRRTDKARDELKVEESRLSLGLATAHAQAELARTEVYTLRSEILPGAQSAYDAAAKGFELGKFGFLDVLDAQRTLFQSKAQYFRALSDYYRATADIERLVGAGQPSLHGVTPAEQQ